MLNSYLIKPSNLGGLLHLAQCLIAWLKLGHFAPAMDERDDLESAATGGGTFTQTDHARNAWVGSDK